jgi:uncharacterized protein
VRVYLDSCIVIYAVESPTTSGAPILKAVADSEAATKFSASGLVWTECLTKPLQLNNSGLVQRYLETLEEFDRLPMAHEDFLLAAELRAAHGLKTPDALHVACAINPGCDEFWTNDDRLINLSDRIKTRRVG